TKLSSAQYDVLTADNGLAAVTIAKVKKPDLIILDILMPGMDGAETAEQLKNDPRTKDIPIIFLTCLVTKAEEEKHIKGGRYFMAKPYASDELLEVIAKHLA
ncbi:MAG: response regulator, partial [Candidatus Omnitrophica bacterium]|nr:response regulator [Candidatus Omnitrophota bacterium]